MSDQPTDRDKTDDEAGPDGVPIGRALAIGPGLVNDDLRDAVSVVLGHFLDYSATEPGRKYASPFSPAFARWLVAATSTPTYSVLASAVEAALTLLPRAWQERRTRIGALRDPEELWARCYTQYVVLHSGRLDLAAGLRALSILNESDVLIPLQWDDDEFHPIAREIERLFRSLGWRSRRPT